MVLLWGGCGGAGGGWSYVGRRPEDLKLYQANNLSADEFIGAVSIDLRRYVEKVARDMDMIYIEKAAPCLWLGHPVANSGAGGSFI